jgi:hypothetical protein
MAFSSLLRQKAFTMQYAASLRNALDRQYLDSRKSAAHY